MDRFLYLGFSFCKPSISWIQRPGCIRLRLFLDRSNMSMSETTCWMRVGTQTPQNSSRFPVWEVSATGWLKRRFSYQGRLGRLMGRRSRRPWMEPSALRCSAPSASRSRSGIYCCKSHQLDMYIESDTPLIRGRA